MVTSLLSCIAYKLYVTRYETIRQELFSKSESVKEKEDTNYRDINLLPHNTPARHALLIVTYPDSVALLSPDS